MKGQCFEIGTIQAFLDGETTPDETLRLTDHVSACDACAQLMAEAEEETSLVFSTLDRELNSLVPTQRLWSRINETIAVEKSSAPVWQKAFAYLRMSLTTPSMTAAAGVLLVVGAFVVVSQFRGGGETDIVSNPQPTGNPAPERPTVVINTTASDPLPSNPGSGEPAFVESKLPAKDIRALAASVRASDRQIRPQYAIEGGPAADSYLADQETYVRTISDLKQNVDQQKDTVMSPSNRVSFERDLAVVNDSISRMSEVVKKNPKNQAARKVLYASYQDKIDLLNSVSQREELMASLK